MCLLRGTDWVFNMIMVNFYRSKVKQVDNLRRFWALLQNYEKRPLAMSCMCVRPSVCSSSWKNLTPTGRIFMKFDIGVCF